MNLRRIPSLDGLRAISISLVLLSHLVKWKHISLNFSECYGTLGVHMFFVLSGYLITTLLIREHERTLSINLRAFYIRRAFRIFPAALAFISVAVLLYWREISAYHLGVALLYLCNMDVSRPWIFGHLWSLGVEEQFYLVWPWIARTWYRRRTKVLVGASIGAPLFSSSLYAMKAHGGVWGSLPVLADQIAVGCLLAVLGHRLPRIGKYFALGMLAGAVLIPLFPADTPGRTVFMLFVLRPLLNISLGGLVLHVIQNPYRLLNLAPVAWFGRISYSLYLWQEMFCSNPNLHLGYSLLVPAITCACLSYYLIEKPMLRLRDKLTYGRIEESSQPLRATEHVVSQSSSKLDSSFAQI